MTTVLYVGIVGWMVVATILIRLIFRRVDALEALIDKLHPEAGWVDAGGDLPIGYKVGGYTPGPSTTEPEPPQGGSGIATWTPKPGASMEP